MNLVLPGLFVALLVSVFTSGLFAWAWWSGRHDALLWQARATRLQELLAAMQGASLTVPKKGLSGGYSVDDDGLIERADGKLVDEAGFEYDPDTRLPRYPEA